MCTSSGFFWAESVVIGLALIFLCIQIVWIIGYWIHRKEDFIRVRQYNATIFICSGACSYQIWAILSIIWRNNNLFPVPRPSQWEIILTTILYIMTLGGSSYIFMYKSWILYYNASYYEAYADIGWKTYISKHNNESNNWFIKNKYFYGNPKYCLTATLLLLFITTCFIFILQSTLISNLALLISSVFPSLITVMIAHAMYCVDDIFKIKNEIQMYSRFAAVSFVSLYILILSAQTPIYIYLFLVSVSSVALFLSVYFQTKYVMKIFKDEIFIDSNNNILHENMQIQIDETSKRKLVLHIIHSNTDPSDNNPACNVTPFDSDLSRNISNSIKTRIDKEPSSLQYNNSYPTPVSSNIASMTPQTRISFDISGHFPDISDLKIPPQHTEKMKKIKLIHIMQDPQWFGLFIRHVTKEFAFENLLYILETVQFQQRLVKELGDDDNGDDNDDDDKGSDLPPTPTTFEEINKFKMQQTGFEFLKIKNIKLAETVPRSQIVFGDCQNWFQSLSQMIVSIKHEETECECKQCVAYNPYKQCVLIYNKYLSSNGILCVNISSEVRQKFAKLFEMNQNDIEKKAKIYLLARKRLIDIFQESQEEVWHLLGASFRRFKKTPIFAKISSER